MATISIATRRRRRATTPAATLAALVTLIGMAGAGCTVNPVTGERQLAIVSAADEVAIGNEQYGPAQQMQGGEYLRDPALTRYVREVGNRLAAVSDRALPYEFVVLTSSVPNAWALPGGKIAVNRGLLIELSSEAELAAVLGHEIVHAAARHGALAMQRGILLQGAVLVASAATRNSDYSGLAVGAAGLGAQLITMRHGREAEFEADEFGMRYMSRAGYDPRAAIDLQQTFVRLSSGRDSGGWLAGLFASHPPSAERVERNRQTAAMLPATGTIGSDAYLAATANIRRDVPGYDALDTAREAFAQDNIPTARREALRALELLPDEAGVESLLGDIELASGESRLAVTRYERAVGLNPGFFYYHLGRGKAHLALGQWPEAESAYRASLALLPTADAYLGLGRIAERQGNLSAALDYYGRAAESSGASGIEAQAAQVRLDLPRNPERYLTLSSSLDGNGRLIVRIDNRTAVEVGDIELVVSYVEGGRAQQVRRTLSTILPPSGARAVATGLGPFAATSAVEARIATARVTAEP